MAYGLRREYSAKALATTAWRRSTGSPLRAQASKHAGLCGVAERLTKTPAGKAKSSSALGRSARALAGRGGDLCPHRLIAISRVCAAQRGRPLELQNGTHASQARGISSAAACLGVAVSCRSRGWHLERSEDWVLKQSQGLLGEPIGWCSRADCGSCAGILLLRAEGYTGRGRQSAARQADEAWRAGHGAQPDAGGAGDGVVQGAPHAPRINARNRRFRGLSTAFIRYRTCRAGCSTRRRWR